ncbi:MAG: mechanosensitive ion channel family protein [Tannerellaceae bacterium]|nr:mechanosensitive ion channel family protein [Tannerellaceae bacterium]
MHYITELLKGDSAHLVYSSLIFLGGIILVIILYRYILNKLIKKARRSQTRIDNFVIEMLRVPFLCLLLWVAVRIFSQSIFYDSRIIDTVNHVLQILLIITIGWIFLQLNNILFYYLEKKVEKENENRYEVRSSITKFTIFKKLLVGLITIVIVAICLMTFDRIRTFGISLLTSAGIAGIILGFAAQKSISMVLAGIQIAITQPIKLNDLVVIDGDSGRIEEIKLTYVVVNLWDKRRLIIPVNYFLEQKFENWTRYSSDIIGAVFIYVDYRIPLDKLKEKLAEIVKDDPNWDHNLCSLNVNNLKETCIELRALVSSEDAAKNSNLQFAIREKMLQYIQTDFPQYLTQTRIHLVNGVNPAPSVQPEKPVG